MADSMPSPEVLEYLRKHNLPIPAGEGVEENQMMREARIGPGVRDYIPAEVAHLFPDLVQGVGRPDFVPDEKYLRKKQRAAITREQEEYGLMYDPSKPTPIKRKTKPFLNPLTGEREVPKAQARGLEIVGRPKAKKKVGRPKKVAAPAQESNDDGGTA